MREYAERVEKCVKEIKLEVGKIKVSKFSKDAYNKMIMLIIKNVSDKYVVKNINHIYFGTLPFKKILKNCSV